MMIVLFTNNYPYDSSAEQNFLKGEVELLSRKFERIILVPREARGELLPLPAGVEVDVRFAKSYTLLRKIFASILAPFSKDFYLDIRERLPGSLSPLYLWRLFFFLGGAVLTRNWVENFLAEKKISSANTVFYTYWFNEISMGIGLVKEKHPAMRLVSRAHGYDIYEELYKPWHCRDRAISFLDGLYSASEAGTKYLIERYPQYAEKYKTALLGVPDPGGVTRSSSDGIFRIVSCSSINPIKRLDLLFAGVKEAARLRSDLTFEWHHFGDGDRLEEFTRKARTETSPNCVVKFHGNIRKTTLIQTYLTQPFDIFVNVSSTEGTPVSIMEAISCGIPVIATAVGGNVEIVNESNGFLLTPNPAPEEIAKTLLNACDQHEQMPKKRQGSIDMWLERYNETKNFEEFARTLIEIRKI